MNLKGKVVWESLCSGGRRDRPLGAPRRRETPVQLPPSYPERHDKKYPVIFYLSGFTGTPRGDVDAQPWKESLFDRLDRLIATGKAPECLMVVPDCFTL